MLESTGCSLHVYMLHLGCKGARVNLYIYKWVVQYFCAYERLHTPRDGLVGKSFFCSIRLYICINMCSPRRAYFPIYITRLCLEGSYSMS